MFFSKNTSNSNNNSSSVGNMIIRPPSALALALAEHDWTHALNMLQGGTNARKLASRWSTLQGFFEGLKDASVLPLHQAVSHTAVPVELVQLLLTSYPAAIQKPESSYQRLPLHCACRTAADPALIRVLLQADQEYVRLYADSQEHGMVVVVSSCLQPDMLGRLPLHYALSNGAHPDVIEMLLQAAPAAAQGVDSRGWMPLHVAVSVGASLAVVQQIHQAYPTAIVMRTLQGSTPMRCLHKMVRHREKLKTYLKQARVEYEQEQVQRLGISSSISSNNMNNIITDTRQLHRATSSPADVAIAASATTTTTTTPAIQNPFDNLIIMAENNNNRPGVMRASSHDGENISCLSPSQQQQQQQPKRKGRKRPSPHPVASVTKAASSNATISTAIITAVPSIMERPLPVRTAVLV